jgi:hypothetical protein
VALLSSGFLPDAGKTTTRLWGPWPETPENSNTKDRREAVFSFAVGGSSATR